MERLPIARAAIGLIALSVFILTGCVNPFAPSLRGSAESLWSPDTTVGGLLQNFATAYELEDSLRYAELLDETFEFRYFDPGLQRPEGWFRETDLRTTARIFRSFQNISLIWGGISDSVAAISATDIPVEIRVQYQLMLDELSPLIGFARFKIFRPSGGRFRILLWLDEY